MIPPSIRRSGVSRLLCFMVLGAVAGLASARSVVADQRMVLDKAASEVRFELPTPQGIITGKLVEFDGEGTFPEKSIEKGEVKLRVNPHRVVITKAPQVPFVRVEDLIQLIPQSLFSFQSSSISESSDASSKSGTFEVDGTTKWRSKEHKVSLPVMLVERSKNRTVITLERSGVIPELGLVLGILARNGQPFTPEGRAQAKLVFKPA